MGSVSINQPKEIIGNLKHGKDDIENAQDETDVMPDNLNTADAL